MHSFFKAETFTEIQAKDEVRGIAYVTSEIFDYCNFLWKLFHSQRFPSQPVKSQALRVVRHMYHQIKNHINGWFSRITLGEKKRKL